MATDDWACAQQLLRAATPDELAAVPASGSCLRLRDALLGSRTGAAGWRDVAALVRQILLETEAIRNMSTPLVVPRSAEMPTKEQWSELECVAVPGNGNFSVHASPWHPPIDPEENPELAHADLRQVYARVKPGARQDNRPADPFWTEALGHTHYVSSGQRQAARTIALAPSGSTTIISLPTGQGKTDVVLAPIIMASAQDRAVSVVVVPTVVLALDMERRAKVLAGRGKIQAPPSGRYAYTGGLAEETKREIRQGIKEGSQKLVFTSPEALVTGLSGALMDAAVAGYLRYLVIDEAHLVEQWGTEFRPEFQTMAAHRMAWMAKAPLGKRLITVAMSATLTERQISTICDLFGAPEGTTALVWASALRKEPSYYIKHFGSEEERTKAVLQAVSLLPKPLALYASRVEDVRRWVRMLRQAGMRRVAEVTGDSNEAERQQVVEGWRTDPDGRPSRFDIVVGTSAFGLGVDLPDVRSVVHACLPETIDRYYQEVGRGGRAGHASVSYLAIAPGDFHLAERLNTQTIIGVEKGWDRWQRMYRGARTDHDGTVIVNLDLVPAHLMDASEQGRQWNVRTLNLMKLAGLIDVQAMEPPRRDEHASLTEFQFLMESFLRSAASQIRIRIVDGGTNDREKWQAAVTARRHGIIAAQKKSLTDMHRILTPNRCVGDTLADSYRTRWNGGALSTVVSCRGCPNCRRARQSPRGGLIRSGHDPLPAVHPWPTATDPLARLRGDFAGLCIEWLGKQERRDLLPELLEQLIHRGMRVLGGPGADREMLGQIQSHTYPIPVILDDDEDLMTYSRIPVIWIGDESEATNRVIVDRLRGDEITYVLRPARQDRRDNSEASLWKGQTAFSIRVALGEF